MFAFFNALILDMKKICEEGWLQGLTNLVVVIIFLGAFGGLVIAAVMKYADNIVKGFATSISIIFSSIVSYAFLNDLVVNE